MAEDEVVIPISGDASGVEKAASEAVNSLNEVDLAAKNVSNSSEASASRSLGAWMSGFKEMKRLTKDLLIPFAVGGSFVGGILRVAQAWDASKTKMEEYRLSQMKTMQDFKKSIAEMLPKDGETSEADKIAKASSEYRTKLTEETEKKIAEIQRRNFREKFWALFADEAALLDEQTKGYEENQKRMNEILFTQQGVRTSSEAYAILLIEKLRKESNDRLEESIKYQATQEAEARSKAFQIAQKKQVEEEKKSLRDSRGSRQEREREEQKSAQERLAEDKKRFELEGMSERGKLIEEAKREAARILADSKKAGEDPGSLLTLLQENLNKKLAELEETRRKNHQAEMKRIDDENKRKIEGLIRVKDEMQKIRAEQESMAAIFTAGLVGDGQVTALSEYLRARR